MEEKRDGEERMTRETGIGNREKGEGKEGGKEGKGGEIKLLAMGRKIER